MSLLKIVYDQNIWIYSEVCAAKEIKKINYKKRTKCFLFLNNFEVFTVVMLTVC